MAKTKISEFSTTPGNNTDINGINIAEGCAPSGINNAIRELMSDLKEWQSGAMDVYVIPQGSIASPGLQLYGDLDTGFYGDAANQLGVAVGGSSVGYFSSSGWVGNVVAQTIDLVNIEVTNIKAKDGTASIALADSTGVATFSKPTVMSVDSASDALRITQIGAGNALLVEDSANPDTSPFVVTAAGLVGVGTLNPTRTIHVSAASGLPGITLESTSNGSSSNGVVVFNRTTTSTLTSQTIGSALWSHNLTDSTLVTAASIIVTGNNTAGSNTANMAIDAKTSTIMKVNGTEVANFASGGLNVTGTVDVTSIETTNIKAKDGTAAASIADSTGAITVTKDLTANGVTLGKGLGSVLTNTALGRSALAANTVGDLNTAVGNLSLTSNTGGTGNTAVGHVAMTSHQGGSLNTAVGAGSLTANLNGNNNTAIGQSALGTATGSNNTAVGSGAGSLITNGSKNTIIGNYDGNQGGLDIRTASNYIVLSDGDGNPRAYWNGANATFGGTLTATTITGTQVNSDNLRLDGNTLSSTDTNGNITIAPNGTGQVVMSGDLDVANIETGAIKARDGTAGATIANSTGEFTFNANIKRGVLELGQPTGLNVAMIKATNTNGPVFIQANGTGPIFLYADETTLVPNGTTAKLTTDSGCDLVLDTNGGSDSGSITIQDGVNGNIVIAPNGTGQVQLSGALDVTNIEVTNIKAKDGTAALSIADSTGVVSVSANPVLSGGTANGVAYLNGSKVLTTGSALTFDGTNLGIGATPSSKLDLGGTVSSTEQIRFSMGGNAAWIGSVGSGTANGLGNLTFWTRDGSSAVVRYQIDGSGQSIWSVAGSEAMRLTSTGLGIGTSSPGAKVHAYNASGADALTLENGSNGGVYARWKRPNREYQLALDINNNGGTGFSLYDATAAAIRWTVDSSGNLGLGVTPSAWGTSGNFDLPMYAYINFKGAAGRITANVYDNAGFKYVTSGKATNYYQFDGQHQFFTAPSGTANDPITFTQAMTLDASGNLLVGTTSASWSTSGRGLIEANGSSSFLYGGKVNDTQIGYFAGTASAIEFAAVANVPIVFLTNNTERARITSGGDFLINKTSSGGQKLQVEHTADSLATIATFKNSAATAGNQYGLVVTFSAQPNNATQYFFRCDDNNGGTERITLRSNGGIANYQSNNADLSDIRTKTDINPLASYWNKIAALEIVTYKYKDQTHDDLNIGVIAQQVEQVAPEFVDPDGFGETPEDGVPLKTIYNKDLTFAAIKALQEAMARIEKLEAEVAALKGV